MRRLSILSIIALLLFGACDKTAEKEEKQPEVKTKATLLPCGTSPRDAFKSLNDKASILDTSEVLLATYKKHLDTLIFDWAELTRSENKQMDIIAQTLNQVAQHEGYNKEQVTAIQNSFCLIESNRLPADEIGDSERLQLFDSLLITLKRKSVEQVLDLAKVPRTVTNESEKIIDADSLMILLDDSLLVDNVYLAESYETIIWRNNNLYLESVSAYNQFIEKNKIALEQKGLINLKKFPNFYD